MVDIRMRQIVWLSLLLLDCAVREPVREAESASRSTSPRANGASERSKPVIEGAAAIEPSVAPPVSDSLLTVAEARKYMLALINRDRAKLKLPPVQLDDGAATKAAQRHVEDMARHGFLGHWGTDGSVPEQRFTEAGGADMVLENASCFVDEKKRTLDSEPRMDPRNIERAEQMFFDEIPPNDGHRKNILKTQHTRVGIGIAQPVATATEIPVPCFTQEFVDGYGRYDPLPARVRGGQTVRVAGDVLRPATVAGVGVAKMDPQKPIPPSEANKRRSYPVPTPSQMYWPAGYKTPIPLRISGPSFSIEVPVGEVNRAGLYQISIWARLPNSSELAIVGLRTLSVE